MTDGGRHDKVRGRSAMSHSRGSYLPVAILVAATGLRRRARRHPGPFSRPGRQTSSAEPSEEPSAPPVVGDREEWIVFQGAELGLTFIRPDGTGNHVILGPPGYQVHPD